MKHILSSGTNGYMSAEMYDPDEFGGISFPADIWAAACVLLQMLTGVPPFAGKPYAVRFIFIFFIEGFLIIAAFFTCCA